LRLCAAGFYSWAATVFSARSSEKLLETLPFQDEGHHPLGELIGQGLDARRALDLTGLTPSTLITPSEKFYVRTACPDPLPSVEQWRIEVRGLLASPMDLHVERDILPRSVPMGVHLLECAGNSREGHFGLMSAADWEGVPLASILGELGVLERASSALVSGYDRHAESSSSIPGADWVFTLEQLRAAGAFLATSMNGAPLSPHHGYPVRLVVPGWYGCCSIKWVNRIEFVDDSTPATEHMKEFAGRTDQAPYGALDFLVSGPDSGFGPRRASDYKAAAIDAAAVPIRVEKWHSEAGLFYRVTGLLWGGQKPTENLMIRFQPGHDYEPVHDCRQDSTRTWTLWSHTLRPKTTGRYLIQLRIDDPTIPARRLAVGYYDRQVDIAEVSS
jgi:DMSO/TMAO reductase YedYZ molybdopterin-dependent catalytic subunit